MRKPTNNTSATNQETKELLQRAGLKPEDIRECPKNGILVSADGVRRLCTYVDTKRSREVRRWFETTVMPHFQQ